MNCGKASLQIFTAYFNMHPEELLADKIHSTYTESAETIHGLICKQAVHSQPSVI